MRPKPTLFHLMFGDQAENARKLASERLLRWSQAFEAWLENRGQVSQRGRGNALRSWSDFLQVRRKPPWEMEESDVLAYVAWLEQEKYREGTISRRVQILSSFYVYAAQNLKEDEAVQDPTSGVDRSSMLARRAVYLSGEEVQALLMAVERKESTLGKRDYALILTRLLTGLRCNELFQLRWRDLRVDWANREAWVRRGRQEREAAELPMEAAEAIWDCLRAAGRLETIQAEDFIFTPLRSYLGKGKLDCAEDWNCSKPMGRHLFNLRLQTYAARAGLDEAQVNLQVLHNTALRLRIEAGDTTAEIRRFFDYTSTGHTCALIRRIHQPGRQPLWKGGLGGGEAVMRGRGEGGRGRWGEAEMGREGEAGMGREGEAGSGGEGENLYGRVLPQSELSQAGKERMDDEISALRVVMMRTLQHALNSAEVKDQLRLLEAFSNAASRLSTLLKTQRELDGGADLFEQTLQSLSQEILVEQGWPEAPPLKECMMTSLLNISAEEFKQLGERDPELARRLVQQVLAMRGPPSGEAQEATGPPEWEDPWGAPHTLAEAYLPRPPTPYVVAGVLPRPSVSMLFGNPGCLKSMLLMDLALCVASGQPWLEPSTASGPPPLGVEQVMTYWLDLDEGEALTVERLAALGRGHRVPRDCPNLLWKSLPAGGFDLLNKAHLGDMSLRMQQLGVKLLCIDNLGIAKGAADENSDGMIPVMSGLRWLAEQTGAAVVVLHHARKDTGFKGRTGDSVRGHSSISGGLDLALSIERDGESPQINLRIAKVRRRPIKPFSVFLHVEQREGTYDMQWARFSGEHLESSGPSYAQLRAAERRENRSTIDDAILESLGEQMLGQVELIEAVRKSLPTVGINQVRKRLDRLKRYNRVEVHKGAHNRLLYSLSEAAEPDDDDDDES